MNITVGQMMMGECIGSHVVHRFMGDRCVVVGVAQEPHHGEWFVLLQPHSDPETTHWECFETFWNRYRLTRHKG